DATSSSMPSRRLMRLRPVVPADTALDVAITVTRLTAAAVLKSSPSQALRKGTRNTPPPNPSSAPMHPATAPDAMMTATTDGVRVITMRASVTSVADRGEKSVELAILLDDRVRAWRYNG